MLLTIIVTAVLIGLDRLFKVLAVQFLAPDGTVTLIPGVVGLRYLENTGAAFGMLRDKQVLLIVVTGIALLVVVGVLIFRRPKDRMEYVAFVMILAGGVGNLIDRIANGYVVDYIEALFMNFAIFNFADCLVVVGFVLLIVAIFRAEHKARKQEKLAEAFAEQEQSADTNNGSNDIKMNIINENIEKTCDEND